MFSRFAVDRPRLTLVVAGIVILLAAPGLLRLELRTDGRALVPADDPTLLFDRQVRRHFGLRDPILVVIDTGRPEGIFDTVILAKVRELSTALADLPGVGSHGVTSLATEHSARQVEGALRFRTFLDPFPNTAEELDRLARELDAVDLLTGTLVSRRREATTILVGVPPETERRFERLDIYRQIRRLVEPLDGPECRIHVVGAPVAEALLGLHILADLSTLLPFTFTVIAIALWIVSRRLWFTWVAGIEVVAGLIFTFGVMGWTGVPVYLTTAILPVILTTVGLADEIHIHHCLRRKIVESSWSGSHRATVRAVVQTIGRPVVLTSLTTAAGFSTFAVSSIPAIRFFGIFAAVGVLFSMAWSLSVTLSCLTLLGRRRLSPPVRTGGIHQHLGRPVALDRLCAPLLARPRTVLGVSLLGALLAAAGIPRLEVQESWIGAFSRHSTLRQADKRINSLFHGTHILLGHLQFRPGQGRRAASEVSRPLSSPKIFQAVGQFEDFLRRQETVGGVLGPYSHVRAVHRAWREPAASEIGPLDTDEIERSLVAFELGRGKARRREVIDGELQRAVVSIFLQDADYQSTARLMTRVRRYFRTHLEPLGGELTFAGDVAVSQAMIPAIVSNQLTSLILAPLACLVAVLAFHRSPIALFGVGPSFLAITSVLGLMGWMGVPLGVATSMFCGITLGISIDYAIHFLEPYLRHRKLGAVDPLSTTLDQAGGAIVLDALAISAGFSVLHFSHVPANARLGLLVGLALLVSCLLTLLGLGAALKLLERPSVAPGWNRRSGHELRDPSSPPTGAAGDPVP